MAIVLVVLNHSGVGSGGYRGVDVFVVISGCLIKRMLLDEPDRTGRVSLSRFYARRIKRLMPRALTAIVAVAAAAAVLFPPRARPTCPRTCSPPATMP